MEGSIDDSKADAKGARPLDKAAGRTKDWLGRAKGRLTGFVAGLRGKGKGKATA